MPYIYALCDPRRPGDVRYIGQTVSTPAVRLKNHISGALRGVKRSHSACWIVSLLNAGVRPELTVLEGDVPTERIDAAEIWWIAHAAEHGWDLVNHHPGGRNGMRGHKMSPESIERMRAAAKRRGNNRSGHRHSAETVAKIRAGNVGKTRAPEQRERIKAERIARYAHRHATSEESRAALFADHAAGASLLALGRKYGLSRRGVDRVLGRV